jgi:hypothetical protein
MDAPSDVVRAFFERMEARDWSGAAELLSDQVHIELTESAEQFDGDNFIAMNRAYPDGWIINVIETLSEDERVAAQVRVEHGPDTFWCAGFYSVIDGKIQSGVEHWVAAGSRVPPDWRRQFAT